MTDRFRQAEIGCPRCIKQVTVTKFIINNITDPASGWAHTFLTAICPRCWDLVQVGPMAGESVESSD